jgi:hypothetical protein
MFTTINIPAGVTVSIYPWTGSDSGTLTLQASGAVVINGTINLSGGPGQQDVVSSGNTNVGQAGGGGFTGVWDSWGALSTACEFVTGNPGQLGFALQGTAGSCMVFPSNMCTPMSMASEIIAAAPAMFGGGAGVFTGFRAYGSGGGGPAGGAPGALGPVGPGEPDCTGASGSGGATSGAGGKSIGAPYDGLAGVLGQTQCAGLMPGFGPAFVGGGGGGSIGAQAANDLAVATTFQTGSGGGGGSCDYLNRPVYGGTSGGGGGGGALKISSPVSITINGQVLAEGGVGGDARIGIGMNAGCDPQPGAAGGGGSGGVIYLSSPSIQVGSMATISAAGGNGGAQSEFATGGAGGKGGLGRIRLSTTPASCTVSGSLTPPLLSGCTPQPAKSGFAYVGTYPN